MRWGSYQDRAPELHVTSKHDAARPEESLVVAEAEEGCCGLPCLGG